MRVKKIENRKVKSTYTCGSCGNDVTQASQYCAYCGGEFVNAHDPQQVAAKESPENSEEEIYESIQDLLIS